jgi:hypothetical protein
VTAGAAILKGEKPADLPVQTATKYAHTRLFDNFVGASKYCRRHRAANSASFEQQHLTDDLVNLQRLFHDRIPFRTGSRVSFAIFG